jgi:hypothetical protein
MGRYVNPQFSSSLVELACIIQRSAVIVLRESSDQCGTHKTTEVGLKVS